MKKVLAVVAVIAVVCVAGAAFAQPRSRENNRPVPPMPQQFQQAQQGRDAMSSPSFRPQDCPCGRFDRKPGRLGLMPDMPEEIRAKVVEAAKLRVDLEAALSIRPIDKAKALEVFTKIQNVEKEIEAWKFAKKLDMMEKAGAQREALRKPRAPRPEAPKPEAPAPAPEPQPEA